MRIIVTTSNHEDRASATLSINGHELALPQNLDLSESDDAGVVAFFTGYAVAMADFQAKLAAAHHDAHDHLGEDQ